MPLATTATHSTPGDLLALPDYGRFELLDGHLVERKMGAQASDGATNLRVLMGYFVRSTNLGLVFQADCGSQILAEEPSRLRCADGSCIRRGRLPEDRPPQGHCRLAPDRVIEAGPPHETTYDIADKIAQMMATRCPQCAYAAAGLAGGPPLGGARRGAPLVGAGGSWWCTPGRTVAQ